MRPRTIETPRLRLSAVRAEDRGEVVALLTDREVTKTYMVPDLLTEEEKTALFERFRALSEREERFVYGIFLSGRLIGLIHEVSRDGEDVEVGYLISPAEQRKGYATEALGALLPVLFDAGFSRVCAGAFSENVASMRVMEKCGMTRLSRTEKISYRGKEHLCVFYGAAKQRRQRTDSGLQPPEDRKIQRSVQKN